MPQTDLVRLGSLLDRLNSNCFETTVKGRFFLIGSEDVHFDDAVLNPGYQMRIVPESELIFRHYMKTYQSTEKGIKIYDLMSNTLNIRLVVQGSWKISQICKEYNPTNPFKEQYITANVLNFGSGIEARLFI